MNIKIKYKKVKRCPDTFRGLPLIRILPNRDCDTYQDTKQTGTVKAATKKKNRYGKGTKVKARNSRHRLTKGKI